MLPSFIIIGVAKSGTTSLYRYLQQHPGIFMCTPKEPDYFSGDDRFASLADYEALFDDASPGQVAGEASVSYFHNPQAYKRIKETLPEARLIAVLRDPAARAYSHYNMMVAHGAIPNRPYLSALQEAHSKGDYLNTGIPVSRYAEPLRRYLSTFEQDQLQIHLYRDYRRDPQGVVRAIFRHVGVDDAFAPDMAVRHNKTHLPASNRVNRFIWKGGAVKRVAKALLPTAVRGKLGRLLRRANQAPVPPLSEEARALIIEVLREDIEQTEKLIGRDLPEWKRVAVRECPAP